MSWDDKNELSGDKPTPLLIFELCSTPGQENYPVSSQNLNNRISSTPNSKFFWTFSPHSLHRASGKCTPWSVSKIQMVWSRPARGAGGRTTAAGHRPVTSSVSSKSTKQQKALRRRDGHLPPARRRHVGSASWGWLAEHPVRLLAPLQAPPQNSHLVISLEHIFSDDPVRMVYPTSRTRWGDCVSCPTFQLQLKSQFFITSYYF